MSDFYCSSGILELRLLYGKLKQETHPIPQLIEAFKAILKEQLREIKNQIRANKTFDNHQSPQQQS